MAKAIYCPYYISNNQTTIYCESLHVESFKDKKDTNKYIKERCGSYNLWSCCEYADTLNERYGAKYEKK